MKALHSASGTGIGYNPGISYRGGELLGAGLAQAGNALAEGIQQFQKNREERDFLDQGMQSRVAALRQFQDFEKTANEDDTSPAGQLLKTFANWDNKSLSAKKAALMDADLLINKGEQAQRRAEDQQWRMLGEQRAQEQLGLQREQLGLERGRTGMEAMRTLLGAYNQAQDNARADRQLGLAEQTAAAQLAEIERRRRAEAEAAAALTGFARDFSSLPGEDFSPTEGRGMLLPMTDLQRRDLALRRNPGAFASDRFDTNATALMRFAPKPSDGWGLKPGQPVPLPGGGLGFATTPNSIQGPPKAEAARFAQPELSKDGKFYRSGPDDNWHPVSQGNPLIEAILAQGGLRPGSLPVVPAAAAPKPTLKFNPKTGFVD